MTGTGIGRTCVDILAIYLVGEQVKVVFLHQIAYLVHFATRVKIARWVVGIADKDALCALVYQFFKLFHIGQRKAILYGCGHGSDGCTHRYGKGHVVGVGRFGYNDFIAGVQAGHESKEHGLRTARCNDDIVGRHVDVILLIIGGEFLSVRLVALRGRVFKYRAIDVLQGVEPHLRRGQIGLSDVQMINFCSSGLCCNGQRSEFSNGRLWHFQSANRDFRHNDFVLW